MKEHWNAFCALSLVHFAAFPECASGEGPILDTIDRVTDDDFFDALEVGRINDDQVRKEVARRIRASHMQVVFGAQPIILGGKLNLNSLDSAERNNAVEILSRFVDQAAEIGCQRFVLLSGPNPAVKDQTAATDALVQAIGSLCLCGKGKGVSIALETFDRDVEKKALIGPVNEAAALARVLRSNFPDFGLLYDMGHMPLLEETPVIALKVLKSYLVHVHVGNCVKRSGMASYGDQHPRFGFPGGENDVTELVDFIRALFHVGYLSRRNRGAMLPWVGFEIRPQPGETSKLVIANLKRAWRQAWAQA